MLWQFCFQGLRCYSRPGAEQFPVSLESGVVVTIYACAFTPCSFTVLRASCSILKFFSVFSLPSHPLLLLSLFIFIILFNINIIIIVISTDLLAQCVGSLWVGKAFGVFLLPGFRAGSSNSQVHGHPTFICNSGINIYQLFLLLQFEAGNMKNLVLKIIR